MAAQPWTVPGVAQVIKPGIHDRIQLLARKVEFAKAQKLTAFEFFLKYLGAVICAPFTLVGISGVINVPANTTIAIFRFGEDLSRGRPQHRLQHRRRQLTCTW